MYCRFFLNIYKVVYSWTTNTKDTFLCMLVHQPFRSDLGLFFCKDQNFQKLFIIDVLLLLFAKNATNVRELKE